MTVSPVDLVILAVAALAGGVAIALAIALSAARARLGAGGVEAARLAADLDARAQAECAAREERDAALHRAAAADAALTLAREQLADDRERLVAMKGEVTQIIGEAAKAALGERKAQFDEVFVERKREFDALLLPLGEQIRALNTHVGDLESKRAATTSALDQRLDDLLRRADAMATATSTLASSFTGSTSARGRWGELHLANLLERSGMSAYCDTDLQETFRDLDGASRPDVLVRVPHAGLRVAIDAKAPDVDYRAHLDATNDTDRRAALLRHVRAIDTRARELADRRYSRFSGIAEAVIMYLPNEGMLAAAIAEDPEIWERAYKRNVFLASPLTLLLQLRAYAAGWAVVQQEENAKKIALSAQTLYRKLSSFAEKLAKVGRSLTSAVNAYNDSLGTFERGVVVQARKMDELGVFTTEAERAALETNDPLDVAVRQIHLPGVKLNGTTENEIETIAPDAFPSMFPK